MEHGLTAAAKVGIRADGGAALGLGHLTRCLALAKTLRSGHGIASCFYLVEDDIGKALVEANGWPVILLGTDHPDGIPSGDELLVIDLPGGVTASYVATLHRVQPRRLIAVFDGTCDGRLEADLVITPIERMPYDNQWQGFVGRRYEGPAYAILAPEYEDLPRRDVTDSENPQVLVTMGGADPYGLTLLALEALDSMPDEFRTTVTLGPAFRKSGEVEDWLRGARRKYEIKRERVLAPLMLASDLAVTSFGTTAYELAATGLPSVALSITPDHVKAAELFARGGSMIGAGLFSSVSRQGLAKMVHDLLSDPRRRAEMAGAGQTMVDGKGARRVADVLAAAISQKSTS